MIPISALSFKWTFSLEEICFLFLLQPTQTELVLLIFLRLAEDILIFQSAPNQRRRDILQGLTAIMPQLFPCFVNTLESNVAAYKQALVNILMDYTVLYVWDIVCDFISVMSFLYIIILCTCIFSFTLLHLFKRENVGSTRRKTEISLVLN